jgi:hypothetical protein
LLDLARGAVYSSFHLPVKPCSTVRGAASLDWRGRPGNYMQVTVILSFDNRQQQPDGEDSAGGHC